MTRESDIQNKIRLALNPYGTFFRANVGNFWTGTEVIRTEGGGVYIPKARLVSTGLPKGFPDLFGFDLQARFCGLEIKTETGRIIPEQKHMIEFLQSRGCRAGIARSPDEAIRIVRGEIV